MRTIGGNPEELDSLRAVLGEQAGNAHQLMNAVRSRLEATTWTGPQAERFRQSWQGDFEPLLRRLASSLEDAAAEVAQARDRLMSAGG